MHCIGPVSHGSGIEKCRVMSGVGCPPQFMSCGLSLCRVVSHRLVVSLCHRLSVSLCHVMPYMLYHVLSSLSRLMVSLPVSFISLRLLSFPLVASRFLSFPIASSHVSPHHVCLFVPCHIMLCHVLSLLSSPLLPLIRSHLLLSPLASFTHGLIAGARDPAA